MVYRAFELPEYHEFIDALGIGPEHIDDGALTLEFFVDNEALVLTLDQPGRSVHIRWFRGPEVLMEIVREGAVRVWFDPPRNASSLGVYFETDSLRGSVSIQVAPRFSIRDRLLFQ